jgi:hypothetical protein
MNALPISLILFIVFLVIISIITLVIFIYRKNKYSDNNVYIKNIFINIGLLILSGILFIIYEKIFNKQYTERWPSLFHGISTIFYLLFFNFAGLLFSIMYSKYFYILLLNYSFFIVSTISTYNLIRFVLYLFEGHSILSEGSSIIYPFILLLLENIVSYIIVKMNIKINNRIRGNCI